MRCWGWLLILLCGLSLPAMGQVGDAVRWSAEWCVTEEGASVATLESRGCRWQPLAQPSGLLASGRTELWLRVQLINESPELLERWLTLGNSRLQHVALFEQDGKGGWSTQQGGKALPAGQTSPVMHAAEAFSLQIPASVQSEYWVRIQSNSFIALDLKLWQPKVLQEARARYDHLWLLSLGMSLALVILALAMSSYARDLAYLYFAVGFLGQILIEVHFSSTLQRGLWPLEWAMPFEFGLAGTTLLVIGGMALVRRVASRRVPSVWLLQAMFGAALISLASLLWSALVDYSAGVSIWLLSGGLGGILAGAICARAWQMGSEAAGFLLGALLLLLIIFGFRLLTVFGQLPVALTLDATMMGLSLIAGAWVLWSLVRSSVETGQEMDVIKQGAASQLALFARISHELRTPLDTILGNTQLLLRQRGQPPDIAILRSVLDSGRHLLGMIDELLDYARGVTGSLKIEPVATRLDLWLAGLERTGQLLAARNQNRFAMRFEHLNELKLQQVYRFDASRLRQAIDNLLVNAARYTRHGNITLGGYVQAPQAGSGSALLHLYVEDNGSGIAPEDHERIFEPFERLSRTSLAGGMGTGMGLPIARQLVSLMGGELGLLSALGRGTRFTVRVPIELARENPTAVLERSLATAMGYLGPRRRLLVVDDDDQSRLLLTRLLNSVALQTEEATGGLDAERLLESGREFDAVITDQFMPDGDGWWVLWAAQKFRPDLPVILVSAAMPHEPLGWNAEVSFAATFLRPLKHDDLLQKLGDLLDLQWVFEESTSAGEKVSLSRPTRDQLVELRQLVAFGEVTAIRDWAQALRAQEPGYAEFADAVEKAVIELDFGRLELLVTDE